MFYISISRNVIRGHSSKTSGLKGGGCVNQCGQLRTGGSYQPIVHKRKKLCFGVCVGVWYPPPCPQASHRKILAFRTFYTRYGPDVFGRGGGVCRSNGRTMLDRRGGGDKKSDFARTSLMDEPLGATSYCILYILPPCLRGLLQLGKHTYVLTYERYITLCTISYK